MQPDVAYEPSPKIKYWAKAITGTLIAFLGALGTALTDKNGVSGAEWAVIALATVIAAGAIWGVPNAPAFVKRAE